MRESNLKLGTKFALKFHKKYGIITFSGTLAIEIALTSLNLQEGANILVSSNTCYSIINTILKLKMNPIIIYPINGLTLKDNDIVYALDKYDIDCIMLIHQFGLFNDIDVQKYKNMNIKIIEDIAQAWDITKDNYEVGKYSDIVVTSFGKTKPISYGIGGGIFFNDKTIIDSIDFCDNESRESERILQSYVYPLCETMDYNKMISLANSIAQEQRKNAKAYTELLKKQKIIKYIDYDLEQGNVWHRFPIWVDDYNLFQNIIKKIENTGLEYQLDHKIELKELPRNKNSVIIDNRIKKQYFILLRTRNINIQKQINILGKVI